MHIRQGLEGQRVADLKMGTASAKQVTLQFGMRAPAGTFCVALYNAALNRSYTSEVVISAAEANTDVRKSVTLTLDTTGTWAVDNTAGLYVQFTLMCGTLYQIAPNAWVSGANAGFGTANQSNFLGIVGNVFELFDVSLTEGPTAPPFQVPDYASELALCERYFYKMPNSHFAVPNANVSAVVFMQFENPRVMRAAPAVSALTSTVYLSASGALTLNTAAAERIILQGSSNATPGTVGWTSISYKASARL
jgi:hypothetical protein